MSHTNQVNTRNLMADAKFYEAYARYNDELERYETWDEAVDRVMTTHRTFYKDKMTPKLDALLEEASEMYKSKAVLGAQRVLQFGGDQLLANHARLYNCSSTYLDRPRAFAESFWMLLSGAGVGFSVQTHHIAKLPEIQERKKMPKTFVVDDSIEGWADALDVLLSSFFVGGGSRPEYEGRRVYFDLSNIRPKGAFISGGFKAPGPEPLRLALDKIEYLIQGLILSGSSRLNPIHAYDIMMYVADAVLSGGVRRAATICLFSFDDMDMMNAKTGNWFVQNPQRGRSNNSVVLIRNETTQEMFNFVMERTKQYGEPGFAFFDSTEFAVNPCFTGDTVVAVADGRNAVTIKELAESNQEFLVYSGKRTNAYQVRTGWKPEIQKATAFPTGYKEVVEVVLSNGDRFKCTPNHQLALFGGDYIEAKDSVGSQLADFFTENTKYRKINSQTSGYSNQYRMIWEYHNGVKLDGMEIDHIDPTRGDFLNNLQLLSRDEHLSKTSMERLGEKNPIHRVKDYEKFVHNSSSRAIMEGNGRYKGLSNEDLIDLGRKIISEGRKLTHEELIKEDERVPKKFSKNRFDGSFPKFRRVCEGSETYEVEYKEKISSINEKLETNVFVVSVTPQEKMELVYDLTVENNHNFYILTSGDDNYENSRGILVHNCFEVGMMPIDIETGETGFQGCNLTEINGAKTTSKELFFKACRAASILGTIQAGYTNFKYLTEASKRIFEREALLGVSLTGWMNSPDVLFDEEVLREGARIVKDTNKEVASIIGINPAARTTVVKPSGTASILLSTASGIHPEHSPRYLRFVQMNKEQEVAQLIREHNPYMVEESLWSATKSDYSIAFPIISPPNSLYKEDLRGINLLEKVKLVQQTWIEEGTNVELCVHPLLRHNVSNTVTVPDNGWDEVSEYIFENKEYFAGISFLSDGGDKDFVQAPFTSVLDANEIIELYGTGGIFGAGLVVDALRAFPNLWTAISSAKSPDDQDKEASDNGAEWIRKFNKFAKNYFDGDIKKAEYCLKDLYLCHKWEKIQQNYKSIDFIGSLTEKRYTDVDTLGAAACSGGACEIF